jgi:hypothetical protein
MVPAFLLAKNVSIYQPRLVVFFASGQRHETKCINNNNGSLHLHYSNFQNYFRDPLKTHAKIEAAVD